MSGSSPLDRFGVDGGGPSSGAIEDTGIAVATATELDVEEPPDKKRKLKAPERESKVKHVEDPFDSFRLQDDKKQPSLQLPLPNPKNSFLAQGTAALNMQVANDLTSGNLAAGTKVCFEYGQRNNDDPLLQKNVRAWTCTPVIAVYLSLVCLAAVNTVISCCLATALAKKQ